MKSRNINRNLERKSRELIQRVNTKIKKKKRNKKNKNKIN